MNWPLVLSTWIHVTGAALLVGGIFFFRVVLIKYAKRECGLAPALLKRVGDRWINTAMGLMVVMLVTGLYNLSQKMEAWKGAATGLSPHMIFGTKFLAFLAVWGVLIAAAIPKDSLRAMRPKLLAVNVVLGLVIIALSSLLSLSY